MIMAIKKLLKQAKQPGYFLLKYILQSDFLHHELWKNCRDLFSQNNPSALGSISLSSVPEIYSRKMVHITTDIPALDPPPVFITARFRSGSTFLWQLFRNMQGVTAYYEPLNERRWFSPDSDNRDEVDVTHIGVSDYYSEYQGMEDLDEYFSQEWSSRFLYMDHSHSDERLFRYISELAKRANGMPVLQFNRTDFRLPWLRANFPESKIIHLYRNPREQWMSIQKADGPISPDFVLTDESNSRLQLFYTLQWADDLQRIFPFLSLSENSHPYDIHYLLWRLSYTFGETYSDISIAYEELVKDADSTFNKINEKTGLDFKVIGSTVSVKEGALTERWKSYAEISWFETRESHCDRLLAAFFKK